MRFLWLLLFCLPVLPVHALDVSVVDGQSRVNATLNQLQQRVETLSNALAVNSDLLTETSQALERVRQCGSQNMIYDEGNDVCTTPPPDPAALSEMLNCEDGETIVREAGNLVCKQRLEDCRVCYNRVVERETYAPDPNSFRCTEIETDTGGCEGASAQKILTSTSVLRDADTVCKDILGEEFDYNSEPQQVPLSTTYSSSVYAPRLGGGFIP